MRVGHRLCRRLRQVNHLNVVREGRSARRHELSLHAWSRVGTHVFEQTWRLSEDGEITPSVAFSGRLSRYTTDARFGIDLDGTGRHAASATLLVNWRLDFNIDGTSADDEVDEIEFVAGVEAGAGRVMSVRPVSVETVRNVHRERFRGWRISDAERSSGAREGAAATTRIGYYLDPQPSGFHPPGLAGDWSRHDVAFTVARPCEVLASDNDAPGEACGESLDNHVDGESLGAHQPVVWFSLGRHFAPSREDRPAITAMEIGFKIVPFDWSARSPFESAADARSEVIR